MKTFKSKRDWWVTAIFFGVCAAMLCGSLVEPHNLVMWAITLTTTIVLVDMYFHTEYTVKGSLLIIKCGFLLHSKYKIEDVRKVEDTHCLISSPALSADRLSLRIGKYDELIISPADKKGFIDALLCVNPDIEVGEIG